MLWEVDIFAAAGLADLESQKVLSDAKDLGIDQDFEVITARCYLMEGAIDGDQAKRLAMELLSDPVVENTSVGAPSSDSIKNAIDSSYELIHVLLKPGVTDPVAQSAMGAIEQLGMDVQDIRTMRKYWFKGLSEQQIELLVTKLLFNEAIEQVVRGPLPFEKLELGSNYTFSKTVVPIRDLDDEGLMKISVEGLLSLSLDEMHTIQKHFQSLDREPVDIELESIAQTWSEHCSHKTLAGRIKYNGPEGEISFENMLKETIFNSTQEIRKRLGDQDWCTSVFKDNAGIVTFDDEYDIVFKVETHNHPSALEPYGGANTGIGGVIRDPLGTGLGAKPICNTDVFCFASPDTPVEALPTGVLMPKQVMKGVVSGVRDYGNRMGIPTVNGAVYFDDRYLGNPLVYCGNVGIIPRDKIEKEAKPGDLIVAIGGRTGRDGIHGATFSSIELTEESESSSGGAVQIGNAITEKMFADVLLEARDRGLYRAVTDCGAGGFSSAVGEMGEETGAEVWLEKCPLKYDGLSYIEIWISEAQERMVLSVPKENWEELHELCSSEGVESTVIGEFTDTKSLVLKYQDQVVCDLSMEFLHDGRPPVIREATYTPPEVTQQPLLEKHDYNYTNEVNKILSSLNVASKEWIIRQYDHEVQGGSVIKPLVGIQNDGPSDAAVVRPRLSTRKGVVISCGMNPHFGDFDTYHMAASAIDEAIRNNVAVGADPNKIAILDNFCWGNTEKSETLGSLVRAALACRDLALELGTPFISGKDSLYNEFSFVDDSGEKQTIAIPPSLLISAMGQVDDVSKCVTMDLKESGNLLYQVGLTKDEMGGSHFAYVNELKGGQVPVVDPKGAKQTFNAVHQAIQSGLVRSCHDMSEGGLATAVAEMAFAGNLGARVFAGQAPNNIQASSDPTVDQPWTGKVDHEEIHPLATTVEATSILLFSESNSRFVIEVPQDQADAFEDCMKDVACALIGEVVDETRLEIIGLPTASPSAEQTGDYEITAPTVVSADLADLKESWQAPLNW